MFDQEHNRVLHDAARRFRDGCLCEDCGVCAYCSCILSCLEELNMNSASVGEESDDGVVPENIGSRFQPALSPKFAS